MSDAFSGALTAVIALAIIIFSGAIVASCVVEDIKSQCDSFGKTKLDGRMYDCTAVN